MVTFEEAQLRPIRAGEHLSPSHSEKETQMRPLPNSKTHGIIHTVRVRKDQVDEIAKQLNIPDDVKKWLRDGEVHIVREADESELNRSKG